MLTVVTIVIFIWLLMKAIGLCFKLTWGVAKITAAVLIGLAIPVLICLLFVGGIVLLVPLAMIAIAAGILKACL